MDSALIFGDPDIFAISYRLPPDNYNYDSAHKMAICHIVIGGIVIGDIDEECYLPTWVYKMARVRNFINENKDELYISDFDNLTDREIFELIIKSNQLEEGFDGQYLYLPQLDNSVWRKHLLTLDETIDAFIICYYIKDDEIKFIIEKWWPEELNKGSANFFYKSVKVNIFIEVLDSAINFLKKTFPYLTDDKA